MDVGTASAVVAGSFAASTPFKPEACSWAVSEIAGARPQQAARGPAPGSSIPPEPGRQRFRERPLTVYELRS
jgi:hypothetical protein